MASQPIQGNIFEPNQDNQKGYSYDDDYYEEQNNVFDNASQSSDNEVQYDYYYGDSDQDEAEVQEISQIPAQTELNRKTTTQLDEEATRINKAFNKDKKKYFRNYIKMLVSKQKKRFESDEFSLDLTYITSKIIAMGFPADKLESLYRNDRKEVKNFFKKQHQDSYKIYNLCSEREYNKEEFQNFAHYPFEDHQAPEFQLIYNFCKDLFKFIYEEGNGENIAAVHCKAGKGRTGVMICCFLMFSGVYEKAIDSLRYYGIMRTKNKKGVTIPSQIRYVQYFEKALQCRYNLENFPRINLKLLKIKLVTIPNFNFFGGCEPFFTITYFQDNKEKTEYNSLDNFKLQKYHKEPYIEFVLDEYEVKGDVQIQFFNKSLLKKKEKMFQFWFNCAFFEPNGVLVLDKNQLDSACKDKKHKQFSEAFHVEVHALRPNQQQEIQIMSEENGYLQVNKRKKEEYESRMKMKQGASTFNQQNIPQNLEIDKINIFQLQKNQKN
ncbi:PTEN tumor-suppressor protein C2 domain protein (macronuclear) [Tetrahymena thermophila SB210]|uniref:Phosphatidylinositol 3,4,5-trisphosphate 3-phosphatase and dual-specificity protein phosphatase PTEN n=1 Tax=Tetrahymena thermophila (strain SB210) TaxID=312017 RepID=I7M716_TETTS|nr:PTEN tumor-suppressor protein C2 domain protein [Tetrahymena thermophila SB210]EAR87674.3 PTEN tumor-suppressor protein C2 domain protein [Tetrahymena thermophila SB210]|eukprot:XP_001007919.3 PTEN tumor-suppressor protein C2 domain protein [Tetrahymena thermophila SB210]